MEDQGQEHGSRGDQLANAPAIGIEVEAYVYRAGPYQASEKIPVDPEGLRRVAVQRDLPAGVVRLGQHEKLPRRRIDRDTDEAGLVRPDLGNTAFRRIKFESLLDEAHDEYQMGVTHENRGRRQNDHASEAPVPSTGGSYVTGLL